MGWIGTSIGALFGARGGSILLGIIGAVIGNWIEEAVKGSVKGGGARIGSGDAGKGELTVLAAISAMMAKMAKADGLITAEEVRYCESVFDSLGLRGEKREYCIRIFRTAKSDAHTIYEYAESFVQAQHDRNMREIVYDILWDVACADGVVSPAELAILNRITASLGISAAQFEWQCSRRGLGGARRGVCGTAPDDADPYAILGASRGATDDELRTAYREKAKALHPDRLRAEGLSEELMGKANEQMAKVNDAWARIKRERGIK